MFRPSRARRALLLVAFSVLASTAAANAECAWVLWLRINRVPRVMLHTHWSAEAWPSVRAAPTTPSASSSLARSD